MFLLPLLVLAMAGLAICAVRHRRAQPASGTATPPPTSLRQRAAFWPTTVEGKLGVGVFSLDVLLVALVNVIQVYLVGPAVLLAALVLTGLARFTGNDHSTAVLIALVVSSVAALAGALFLAGEVFIGHD